MEHRGDGTKVLAAHEFKLTNFQIQEEYKFDWLTLGVAFTLKFLFTT